MLRLPPEQRKALGETLRQLANLVATAFVLGQFVGSRAVSWPLFAVGAGAWLLLVWIGLMLHGKRT